jgi:hypothetical protein
MATNISAEFSSNGPHTTGKGSTTTVSSISKADVTVNTTPNNTGGWNTAVVTADLARTHVLGVADGVPPGVYEKVSAGVFRLNKAQ